MLYYYDLALYVPLNSNFTYYINDIILVNGQKVLVEFKNKKQIAYVVKNVDINTIQINLDKIKPIIEVYDFIISKDIFQLCLFITNYYKYPLGLTIFTVLPNLQNKNYKLKNIRNKNKLVTVTAQKSEYKSIVYTSEQLIVLDKISQLFQLNIFKPIILYGVTGSGKTEIYVKLIRKIVLQQKQVLVLLPEINLTPQLLKRFYDKLINTRICLLNSNISDQQRFYLYQEIREGRVDVIIGTRLSIFTDFAKLGLIIVDEEHDLSFKQNDSLRYHARDVAVYRAKYHNIPIILGSATPSLETLYNYKLKKYELVKLQNRAVEGSILPRIKIIDLTNVKLNKCFSETVIEAISMRLYKNELVLIYINRRGYAPIISCYDCGYVFCCKNCSSNLVFHNINQILKCHKCSYFINIPSQCKKCGGTYLKVIGDGTQRIEADVNELFPTARVLRIDQDVITKKDDWLNIYNKINNNEVDIIIGTQMLVKGHDFHNLTLVVGLNLDSGLYSSDFRATEIMFTQLIQVSGRAGRGKKPGEVMLQTRYPSHEIFKYIVQNDYSSFVNWIMKDRRKLYLPPFTYYALISANDYSMKNVMAFLTEIYNELNVHNNDSSISILNPVESIISKLKNRNRANILVIASNKINLINFLASAMNLLYNIKKSKSLIFSIDVDPYDMR
jgi:primosomal protein N' (replication factor Y)